MRTEGRTAVPMYKELQTSDSIIKIIEWDKLGRQQSNLCCNPKVRYVGDAENDWQNKQSPKFIYGMKINVGKTKVVKFTKIRSQEIENINKLQYSGALINV